MNRVGEQMSIRELIVGFGQTEASPVITLGVRNDPPEYLRVGTVGSVMPNTEIKVVSLSGETVQAGEQGEICTRGYLVIKGYDVEPEATARAIDSEGWLRTGDLGVMRPDGYFHITGRAKEMIIRGGENIFAAGNRRVSDYSPQDFGCSGNRVAGCETGRSGAGLD